MDGEWKAREGCSVTCHANDRIAHRQETSRQYHISNCVHTMSHTILPTSDSIQDILLRDNGTSPRSKVEGMKVHCLLLSRAIVGCWRRYMRTHFRSTTPASSPGTRRFIPRRPFLNWCAVILGRLHELHMLTCNNR